MNPSYSNDHSRLLDRIVQEADAHAAKAASYSTLLTNAKAELAEAERYFFSDPSNSGSARHLVETANKVRDLTVVASAIESGGGLEEIRGRHLRSNQVFATFSAGFAERASVIEKLAAPARKRLAQRRARLAEAGIPWQLIEQDPHVAALRAHEASIAPALAVAVYGRVYSDGRGQNREPRAFNDLYSALTTPLPQPPPEPAV